MTKTQAIVFPGQGSQEVGMLADFYDQYPAFKIQFDRASSFLGYDLWKIVQEGPADTLNQTVYTQPAMLTADWAIWNVLKSVKSLSPAWLAGHSLGEYAALVAAEALMFEDALFLVDKRARLMQEAVPEGIGAAGVVLGLTAEVVVELCKSLSTDEAPVDAVNFNSPVQTVIAGKKIAVDKALVEAKAGGAKRAMLLPLSIPVHCALMKGIAPRLADYLSQVTFHSPKVPVIQNADVKSYSNPDDIRDALVRQLYSPVRWVETVETMKQAGVQTIIECGPKAVLTGLIKRIDPELELVSTEKVETFSKW